MERSENLVSSIEKMLKDVLYEACDLPQRFAFDRDVDAFQEVNLWGETGNVDFQFEVEQRPTISQLESEMALSHSLSLPQ